MCDRAEGELEKGSESEFEMGRGAYSLGGTLLLIGAYQLVRLAAGMTHGRFWTLFHLVVEPSLVLESGPTEAFLFSTLGVWVAASTLLFVLTLRRLESTGLSRRWAFLSVVPLVQFVVFLALSLWPPSTRRTLESDDGSVASRLIPESALGSVWFTLVATVPLAFIGVAGGVWGAESYGWGMFVLLPFWMGMTSVYVYSYHRRRGYWKCVGVALLATGALGVALFVTAVEGLLCIVMAAPIGMGLAIAGASVGFFLQRSYFDDRISTVAVVACTASVPLVMGFEAADTGSPPELLVESSVEISAPPEVVWHRVVTFDDLPEPRDWLFSTGIAYPTHATIEGRGVGAVRRCEFSTGAFVEPIRVWEEPHRLAFDVRSQPAALEETAPFGSIEPPHVDSMFRSQRGEFELVETEDGGTRLIGRTWYRHRIWPVAYWRVFSDRIIHRIHMRVLRHIERTSESRGDAA